MKLQVAIAVALGAVAVYLWWSFPRVWLAIIACMLPALLIAVVHGERINILAGRRLGFVVATKGNSIAMAGAFFLPGRITEILKPLYYYKMKSLPISVGLSTLLVERIFDVIAVIVIATIALALSASSILGLVPGITELLVGLSVVIVLGLLLVVRFPGAVTFIIRWIPLQRIREFIEVAYGAFRESLAAGFGYWSIVLTVLVWAGSLGLYWLYLQMDGGLALTIDQVLVVFVVGTFGITVTVTPGGIGTFEAMMTLLLEQYGYPIEVALASALGLRLIGFFPNAIVAGYAIIVDGFQISQARREMGALRGDQRDT